MALAEPVYLFAELSRLICEESTRKPNQVEYRIRIERMGEKEKPASLSDGQLDPVFFESGDRHIAPASDMNRSVTIDWRDDIDSGAVTYEIVREVYHWFGISDDGVPYTEKNAHGATVIDREALIKAGIR